ncbi:MAG: hypothetical protein KC592_19765, partial [Nitrospira sp.]|nr:hypothetical protein [Nitrospira sp.]
MKDVNSKDRQRLAEKLKSLEPDIIDVITTNFFQQHPEPEKYGEAGRMHCATDTRYHLTFLRTALEFGTPETFKQYLRWTTNVLQTRNIPHQDLQRFLEHISCALEPYLADSENMMVRSYLLETLPESPPPENLTAPRPRSPLTSHQEVFLQALLAG